jgi:cephalosporin hydroxylase
MMKLTIDTEVRTLTYECDGEKTIDLYSTEAFRILSDQWVSVGWNQKYPYTFSWMGRPIIQLPEDLIRIQEVIYRLKPDVIVETGVAHGGSLIFYAGLCKAMEQGRIIGVDIEIRKHNREAIESHELFSFIDLVEGGSTDETTVETVRSMIKPDEKVLVILDSCHTREHVLAELKAYHSLVCPGSYMVATDGVMRQVADVPRGQPDWEEDNPTEAAQDFLKLHDNFVLEQPEWPFNESELSENVTHWPGAWLRRVA